MSEALSVSQSELGYAAADGRLLAFLVKETHPDSEGNYVVSYWSSPSDGYSTTIKTASKLALLPPSAYSTVINFGWFVPATDDQAGDWNRALGASVVPQPDQPAEADENQAAREIAEERYEIAAEVDAAIASEEKQAPEIAKYSDNPARKGKRR